MPRVALVHDFLLDLRGAERVFAAICDVWPEADVFTAVYDEAGTEGRFAHRNVNTSFLQRVRPDGAHVPAAAAAVPARDGGAGPARLRPRRLVLERLGARRARRPRRRPRLLLPQPVPLRVVRARGDAARRAAPLDARRRCGADLRAGASGTGSPPSASTATSPTRRRPARASRATSGATRRSCTRRCEISRFAPGPPGEHYLVLAELMAAQAHRRGGARRSTRWGGRCVVVGDGPERRRLRRLAGPTVRFAGPRRRRARSPSCWRLRGARRHRRPRSSGSPRSRRRRPGRPGHRAARGRRARDARRGRHRRVLRRARSRARWRRRSLAFDDRAVDPQACVRERRALRGRALRGGDRRGRRGRATRAAASRGPARARPRARRAAAARRPGLTAVRVAVVVPCRDGRRWLPGLLASVREQTRAPERGARRRRRVPRRLAPTSRAREGAEVVELDRNVGFAAAANRGHRGGGRCDAVALVNTDVVLAPDWLARTVRRLEPRVSPRWRRRWSRWTIRSCSTTAATCCAATASASSAGTVAATTGALRRARRGLRGVRGRRAVPPRGGARRRRLRGVVLRLPGGRRPRAAAAHRRLALRVRARGRAPRGQGSSAALRAPGRAPRRAQHAAARGASLPGALGGPVAYRQTAWLWHAARERAAARARRRAGGCAAAAAGRAARAPGAARGGARQRRGRGARPALARSARRQGIRAIRARRGRPAGAPGSPGRAAAGSGGSPARRRSPGGEQVPRRLGLDALGDDPQAEAVRELDRRARRSPRRASSSSDVA